MLVTGDTGFKGAWLCAWLSELGAEVHGLALDPPTSPNLWEQAALGEAVAHRRGDVRDLAAVAGAVEASEPELVLHLAAQSLVRESYDEPVDTFATNVMGVVNVLEAIRKRGRPCAVVVVTSDKCYANAPTAEGHAEGDPLGGRDPYSASKGAAEVVTASYRASFFAPEGHAEHGVGLASVRAGNVIGPGDWAKDRIVPDAIRALSRSEPVGVRNPDATRPWQHVLEPLAGYLGVAAGLLGEAPVAFCQAWNFGPELESCRPVRDVVEGVIKAWGRGGWESAGDGGPPEAPELRLSVAKAARELRWHPVWRLEQALVRTAEGYRALLGARSVEAVRAVLSAEIETFRDAAAARGEWWALEESPGSLPSPSEGLA